LSLDQRSTLRGPVEEYLLEKDFNLMEKDFEKKVLMILQ
jgi:hypothetical protein